MFFFSCSHINDPVNKYAVADAIDFHFDKEKARKILDEARPPQGYYPPPAPQGNYPPPQQGGYYPAQPGYPPQQAAQYPGFGYP